ncbi:two-component regulator propeller domain-containing protein [uncultured Bacteroides sp.]|uniref:hybrid sensor histidine kinase/response regulator transcription factor n=1 Tax=uncultured Bacteroides sp. TaxID=162156 RepID=UPI002AA7BFD2|nr:two-component regulator propeller domain-containing protein [uncultured Bacteroides sp.]
MKKNLYTLFVFFLIFPFFVFAQGKFMFKHLEVSNGLSHSQVNCIYKDSRGFMWFGTVSGLNRYDGYNYKLFQHVEKDTTSVIDNYISNIQEDANADLWINTGSGYTIYDSRKERFRRNISAELVKYGINHAVELIYIDKQKNILCFARGLGIYQYNNTTKKLSLYRQDGRVGNLSRGIITDIRENKTSYIFLFRTGLLECVDKRTGKVIRRDNYIPAHFSVSVNRFSAFVDSEGDYWIYSDGSYGVWLYHSKERSWEYICNMATKSVYMLSSNVIRSIDQDAMGNVWIGADHGGINLIDKQKGRITYLENDATDERSISHNSIYCIYRDNTNIMWVGTYKKGISYYSESIFKFEVDHMPYLNNQKNLNNDVTIFAEDTKGNLWIGTNGAGVICYNRATGERKLYQHIAGNSGTLTSNIIVSLCAARDGKIWIGTYLGGMDCFDGSRFIHYKNDPKNPNSLANNNVWSIVEDAEGYIWIGTLGSGLQRLNPKTGQFVTFNNSKKEQLSSESIASLCLGRDNILYIGTAIGVTTYNLRTGVFERIRSNKRGDQSFSNLNVNQLYEDSRGLLWIATREGLNIFDRKNDKITPIHKTDGLADNVITGVIEDNNKNMWITTSSGVSNIIVGTNPKTGNYTYTYYNYDERDGLQSSEFNIRSVLRSYRGEILMGGIRGYNIFNPEVIKYNRVLPKVVFTDLQLFNNSVKVDSVYDGNCILKEGLNWTKEIVLNYSQNVFSIDFSSMNYVLPEKTKYAYMLEGFNSDWLTTNESVHKITYTNLAPGTYTLKVKAANSDGFWNEDAASIKIVIKPPFWRSGLAYIFYFFLLIGILLRARHQILKSERSRYKLHQIELEAQRNHEIDDMKLRFFTNISHELRTPLTLIISPLENVIKTITNDEQKNKLEMVHRNALRLLNLVNQLIDFRKLDVQGHQINLSCGDIIIYLKNICSSFAELSEKKNIRLTFYSSIDELQMEFDEDKIGKIMMNLLSNAFKFTNEGGRVEVHVNLLPAYDEDNKERLEIRVADTGIGINDDEKEKIFERFYQVKQSDDHKFGGSGIGLHMVKEFVLLHKGTVEVHNNAGKGSIFVVTIPVNRKSEEGKKFVVSEGKVQVINEKTEELAEASEINAEATTFPVILVVDDNDDFRTFMKDSLKSEFVIQEARNGKEAWESILDSLPDMIISDVMMPEMDGNELCRLVKSDVRTSHIPLILLTARTAEEHKLEGLETGADDYITKPFNFDILMLRIRKLMERRDTAQETFRKQIDVKPSDITITSLDEKLIQRAIKYVEDNISSSNELSVEELSKHLGMSRVHLYKKLLSITGKTPIEFIRTIRLKRAAQLLRESQLNISEIAYQVGFNNPKYFSKYFKEEFGMLPSAYQDKKENDETEK